MASTTMLVPGIRTIGAAETKGRQESPDQVWEVNSKPLEVHPACRPGRCPLCTHDDVRLRGQGTKALLILRLVYIQDDAAFIQVGMDEGQAQAFCPHRQPGGHVPPGGCHRAARS